MATDQEQPTNNPTTTKVSSKEERTFKIQDNKPLLAVIAVIGLIMLTAIGVGLYALISGVTNGDENPKEDEQVAQASQDEDGDSSDSEEDNNSEEKDNQETDNSDEEESNSDSQEDESSDDKQDSATSDNDSEDEDATVAQNDSDENSTDKEDSEGNIEANGAVSAARKISSLTQEAFDKSLDNQARINESGVWYATDYEQGDILGDSHTVQLGDTLWEIADGLYGDGAMWTQIEAANFDSIGYLPNGQHALITPGTVLVLPSP